MCILVYNDASYAAEVHYFGRQGFSTDIVKFPDTDFAAIARGYGARAATVRTLADLDPVKAWVAEGAPGVFVIDGKINPESRSRLARRAFSVLTLPLVGRVGWGSGGSAQSWTAASSRAI